MNGNDDSVGTGPKPLSAVPDPDPETGKRSGAQSAVRPGERNVFEAKSSPGPTETRTAEAAPKASFAAIQSPTIDLPKGGGALRGIGETLRTNPSTGTASFGIPLPLTQAVHGPTPSLGLSYDSGQGNGPFGAGWAVAVPQISRRTDKLLPEYRDTEDSDTFLLSGAEDLVPLFTLQGATWTRDRTTTSTEVIERYRPRIEGLFARIERHTVIATGDVYWKTISRDNVASTFGSTPASRIVDPGNARRIFSWLLDQSQDDRGHVTTFIYKSEDFSNVNPALPSEAYRLSGLKAVTNRYLKRVRYGNATPGDPTTYRLEVVFDYGEHDRNTPSPQEVNTWPVRADAFSSYRPGFEVRSYRLCQRVLMFHSYAAVGTAPLPVRALELTYDGSTSLAKLRTATQRGYARSGTTLTSETLPTFTLSYTEPTFQRPIRTLQNTDVQPEFPRFALGRTAQWVDLDGEGLPGVLINWPRSVAYQRNLGDGELTLPRKLPQAPNLSALEGGGSQVANVAGTMSMLTWSSGIAGFHERVDDGWAPFVPFRSQPSVDWGDPNLRLVDLNGDGFDDILVTRGDHLLWWPSLGRDGFGPARRVPLPRESTLGPVVVFADRRASIFLADMTGDGLTDIVRVTWSGISYWPNLGYGHFGVEQRMDRSPTFCERSQFNARQVRLADLDGSGTADLLYFTDASLSIWLNQAGNGWSTPFTNEMVPLVALRTMATIDFYGKGMSALVWSPKGYGAIDPPLRAYEPFGPDKPHLLKEVDNGMGKTVRLGYLPSTQFYLADRAAGRKWPTKLPFPVQVVSRVETYDAIARTRLVSTYAYHDGYYDTVEREFRGFGFVEQTDAETFASETGTGLFPDRPPPDSNDEEPQPPVLTKTWFHQGAFRESTAVDAAHLAEWWPGDAGAPPHLACTVPTGLSPEDAREAFRALKGAMIRQEVYGLDGTPSATTPFSVTERSYTVVVRQPKLASHGLDGSLLYGVYQSLEAETRALSYERVSNDPRLLQTLALAYDPTYGMVTTNAVVAYPRRTVPSALPEQGTLHCIVAENLVAHADTTPTALRIGIPLETRIHELTGLSPGVAPLLAADILTAFNNAVVVPYEQAPTSGLQRRQVERIKIRYYDSGNIPTPLPFGSVDARSIVYETYRLDLTDSLLSSVFGTRVTGAMLTEGGYVTPTGETGYWQPSGRSLPVASHFYLPASFTDPYANTTSLTYDADAGVVTQVTDAKSNTFTATIDYRVLAASLLTDPNGNRSQVAFDELGRVTALAVMGKTTETVGDTLASPTSTYAYDLTRFAALSKPNRVHVLTREVHTSVSATTRFQESYVYSDGSGRIAMTKNKVEPGMAPARDVNGNLIFDSSGNLVLANANPRWVGSGKTVLNNKGSPVKQYEPFFSSTFEYETEVELVKQGVTPLSTYDALGRATRTDLPNGSYRRSTWDAWTLTVFDENDTVDEPGNKWRAARQPTASPTPTAAEQRAATLTDAHANTPTVTNLDTLGRTFLGVQNNGGGTLFQTRSTMDIEGQVTSVQDALARSCQTNRFSIGGQLLQDTNIDSGTRLRLATVLREPLRRWDTDAPTRVLRYRYDELRRPSHLYATLGTAAEILLERRYYGEALPGTTSAASNVRTRLLSLFDGSGFVKSVLFDFKGNLLTTSRRFAVTYNAVVDWSAIGTITDPTVAEAHSNSALVHETFALTATYDALNRVVSAISPDNGADPTSITLPTYDQSGSLQTVGVQIRGATTTTPFITNIVYDALGRRTSIAYQNGTSTIYAYDPLTFRLATLTTTRGTSVLQNIAYTYDPVGNVVAIADGALQTLLFSHSVQDASTQYVYDPTYRLTNAAGRESSGNARPPPTNDSPASIAVPDANTGATARYTEAYAYDAVANITQVMHVMVGNPSGSWTRRYDYGDGSTNRLRSTDMPGDTTAPYSNKNTYDGRGNTTSMSTPALAVIDSSPFDQMSHANLGGGGDGYYVYASGRTRVRKVVDRGGGLLQERLYFGSFELYRQSQMTGHTQKVNFARESLHVMDGVRRVAMIETKTVDLNPVPSPVPRFRYQLGNQLESVALETDAGGNVFSYEEFFPYGGTAYRSGENGLDVSAKTYRYCGSERDDETGFYCMGARYYVPWLGRWTTADPLGLQAGINLYLYCRAGPVTLSDPSGLDPTDVVNTVANTVVSAAKAVGSAIVGSASSEPRYGTTTSVNVDAVLEGVPYAGDDDPETAQSIRWDLQAKFARQAETDALARANTYDQHRPTAEAGNFPPTLYYVAGKSGSRIAPIYARDENGNYPNALRPGESALPLLKDWEYENVNGTIQAHKDPNAEAGRNAVALGQLTLMAVGVGELTGIGGGEVTAEASQLSSAGSLPQTIDPDVAEIFGAPKSGSPTTTIYHGGELTGGKVGRGVFSTTPELRHAQLYGPVSRFDVPHDWLFQQESLGGVRPLIDRHGASGSVAPEWRFQPNTAPQLNKFRKPHE